MHKIDRKGVRKSYIRTEPIYLYNVYSGFVP